MLKVKNLLDEHGSEADPLIESSDKDSGDNKPPNKDDKEEGSLEAEVDFEANTFLAQRQKAMMADKLRNLKAFNKVIWSFCLLLGCVEEG